MLRKLTLALLFCGSATLALAQQGVIRGTVLEPSGEPTIGANVIVVGSDPVVGTTTDFDGAYQLSIESPSAPVTLLFTYIGFADKTVEGVTVTAGEVTFLDVNLQDGAEELSEVVVTAQALQNTDIAITKIRAGSDKILDGISSQQIARLSLSDAAQAMTKVVGTTIEEGKYIVVRGLGDRYSTAQLNGLSMPSSDPYRNSPQLDLIPSSLLDNIITSKTFSPDQPGAFTGGNVNLQTVAFPDFETISVSIGAGYNTQASLNDEFLRQGTNDTDNFFGYTDNARALNPRLSEIRNNPITGSTGRPVNILSNEVSAQNYRNEANAPIAAAVEEASDLINADFATPTQRSGINHSARITYGNAHDLRGQQRLGYIGSVGFRRGFEHYSGGTEAFWRLEDAGASALNANYIYDDTYSVEIPEVNAFGSMSYRLARGQTIRALGVYNHRTEIGSRFLEGPASQFNIEENQVLQNRALPFLERSVVTGQLSGEHALNADSDLRLEWAGSLTRSTQDEPSYRLYANTRIFGDTPSEPDVFRIQSASYARPLIFFRDLEDVQGQFKFDLFKDLPGNSKIQVGATYQNKDRDFSESVYEIATIDRNEVLDLGPDPSNFYVDENMGFIPETPSGRPGVANFVVDGSTLANSYTGFERISAAYAMGTWVVSDRFRAVGGLRVERTELEAISADTAKQIGIIDETNFLPSVNLIFKVLDTDRGTMNLRGTFTQTIARPNMREVAPFSQLNFIGGPTFSGNPDLGLTTIDNFDLRWEYFGNKGGLLSASGFYKNFTDPIVATFLPATRPEFIFLNVPEARVTGIELEARQRLGNFVPALQGFNVGANVSLIDSEAPVPAEELARIRDFNPDFPDSRPLQGQSPYIVNANIGYDGPDGDWDVTAAFNIFGERLAFNGIEGTPDVYERPRPSLDLTARKDFGAISLSAAANNLLDPEFETFSTFAGEDFAYSSFRRGRTFSVSVGYTFKR